MIKDLLNKRKHYNHNVYNHKNYNKENNYNKDNNYNKCNKTKALLNLSRKQWIPGFWARLKLIIYVEYSKNYSCDNDSSPLCNCVYYLSYHILLFTRDDSSLMTKN